MKIFRAINIFIDFIIFSIHFVKGALRLWQRLCFSFYVSLGILPEHVDGLWPNASSVSIVVGNMILLWFETSLIDASQFKRVVLTHKLKY